MTTCFKCKKDPCQCGADEDGQSVPPTPPSTGSTPPTTGSTTPPERLQSILNVSVTEGREAPPDLFDDESMKAIREVLAESLPKASRLMAKYVPHEPGYPWRDFHVQQGVRRFLKDVVLPWWIQNHTHDKCSNIRVDEWGRLLCRYITPTNGVDGPWENPTHFVFYAYNNFQTQQTFGIRLKTYLADYCDIFVG